MRATGGTGTVMYTAMNGRAQARSYKVFAPRPRTPVGACLRATGETGAVMGRAMNGRAQARSYNGDGGYSAASRSFRMR